VTDPEIILWFWLSTVIMLALGAWAGFALTKSPLPRGARPRKG
jgi:hypothetical protein